MMTINLDLLIDGLEELADQDLQLRRWADIENINNEVSSLAEALCAVFDDSNVWDSVERDAASPRLSPGVVARLRQLGDLSDAVDREQDLLEMIQSPEMDRLRAAAKETLKLLRH